MTIMRFILLALLLAQCSSAQLLFLLSVQNAANPSIQGAVVPDSLATITATLPFSTTPVPLPKTLDVTIHGKAALVVGAEGASVTVLVPASIPLGEAVLSIVENGGAGVTIVDVVASDFGLFTNSSGIGQAVAQNVVAGVASTNNLTHPAHPGDTVTLSGTGLGSVAPSKVAVLLGGHPAPVSFAGHSAAIAGADTIDFQVPSDPAIPNGCFVAVEVVVNGARSNTASISKAAEGAAACTPPIDLTVAQMTMLDAGQSIPYVSFLIDGLVSVPPGSSGLVRDESFNVQAIAANEATLAVISQPLLADDVFYSCTPSSGATIAAIFFSAFLDLGPELTLTGPGTTGFILTSPYLAFYSLSLPTGPPVSSPAHLPPPYFVPGVWQIASPGAPPNPYPQPQYSALPFSAQITTPPTIELTNYSSLQAIDPQKGVVVAWNPLGYGPSDVVTVNVAGVSCNAHATDGQLSIPPGAFPTTTAGVAKGSPISAMAPPVYFQISASPRPDQIARTDIPQAGGGFMPGIFKYSFTESFPIHPPQPVAPPPPPPVAQ